MNREIKFRVWDKMQNSYLPHYRWDIWNHVEGSINSAFENERFEFQQFTYLKDKNGKEIYDGDILLDPTANGGKYKQVYQSATGEWQISYHKKESSENGFRYFDVLYDRYEYSEVVGNVFENKELLEIK